MLKSKLLSPAKGLFIVVLSLLFGCSGAQKTTQIENDSTIADSSVIIDNETTKIEEKEPETDSLALIYPTNLKSVYNISYFLPFFLNEYPNVSSRHRLLAEVAMDYWWGAQLAYDTLKYIGFNANVGAIDTENDTSIISRKLKSLTDTQHLIFGPLLSSNLGVLKDFTQNNMVNVISPLATVDGCDDFSDRIIFSKPTINEINKSTAEFIYTKYDTLYDIYIFHRAVKFEKEEVRNIINSLPKRVRARVKVDEINKNYVDKNYLKNKLPDSAVVVICSDKETFVTTVIAELRRALGNYKVIGREKWLDYQSMDADAWQRLNMHFVATQNINYSDTLLKSFIRKYRVKYKAEPSKYAISGYFESIYYSLYLYNYGTNFQRFKNELDFRLPYSHINIVQDDSCKFFYNNQVKFLTFKNHKLIEVE
ncbi:MAG: hypothetical protein ACPGLV_10515 [Bacteroidia bacterium]